MKKKFSPSELILRPDGSVYHLGVKAEDLASDIILVGDPDRVSMITDKFQRVEVKKQGREFHIHTGEFNGKRISVVSTGIGVDNIDIVINELDAAVNINPEIREVNSELKYLNFYRLGTSGTLRNEISIDSIICSQAAIGMDGVPHFYDFTFSDEENELAEAFSETINWPRHSARAYAVFGAEELIDKINGVYDHLGVTVTANGFYAPQNRAIRIPLANPSLQLEYQEFEFKNNRLTNLEMETAGIYALTKMLGHSAVSLSAILANRATNEFSSNPKKVVEGLIDSALQAISK